MLGAGHIGEYLLHHCNLYKHSKQGWEAFNSLLKTFFCCTGRGGAGNKGTGMKSKILPIARWLSHRMLWMMGYDFDRVLLELRNTLLQYDLQQIESDNDNSMNSDFDDDRQSVESTYDDNDDNNNML